MSHHTKSGERVPMEGSASTVDIAGSRRMIASARDISKRKRAEDALRQSEERYRRIIETAEEGIWMIDAEGKTTFTNSKMAEMLGYTVEGMAGQPVSAFMDDEWRAILKAKLARRRQGERDRYDIKYLRKDGSELWAIVSTRPILNENGQYVGALGMHTDISDRKRVEEALRQSEERFKRAMEASRLGTWEWDVKTGKVSWSESLELIHGMAPGTFGGTFEAFMQDVHPDDREWVAQAVGSSLIRGTHDIEYRILLADGSVRWMAGKGQVLRDDADQPLGMVGTCTDITERKQAEKEREELLTREQQTRAEVETASRQVTNILESITDGFVTLDSEWRYTYINREAEKVLRRMKRKREELIGKNIWEEFPEAVGSRSYKEYQRAVAEQVTVEFEEHYTSIGRWYGIRAYPSKDGLSIYTRDITERKQAENALAQLLISEQGARAEAEDMQRRLAFLSEASALLAAASPDMSMTLASIARLVVPQLADWCAIDVLDEDESIRRVALVHHEGSQVDLTQEQEGRYPVDLKAPSGMPKVLRTGQSEFYPEISDSLLATIAREAEQLESLRGLGFKSGMCVPLSARGRTFGVMTLMSAESGRHHTRADLALAEVIARRAGLALDNARLYEELRKANEAKDEFLGLISHELRTPITAIYGGARMLRSRAERLDEESRTSLLTDIEQESERLYRMVEDLLTLARVELGQEVTMEPVLAQRVIEKVAAAFKQRRPSRRLKKRIEKDLASVAAEPVYLEQVLRNLLSNADKYSPMDSPIEIRAKRNGNAELAISVLDRGPGVAPEEVDTIFERFYRSSRTSKQAKGAGMGLTVCKRLVEAQSGRIWAKPRKRGGLEIGFTLPLYEEVAA